MSTLPSLLCLKKIMHYWNLPFRIHMHRTLHKVAKHTISRTRLEQNQQIQTWNHFVCDLHDLMAQLVIKVPPALRNKFLVFNYVPWTVSCAHSLISFEKKGTNFKMWYDKDFKLVTISYKLILTLQLLQTLSIPLYISDHCHFSIFFGLIKYKWHFTQHLARHGANVCFLV